MCGQMKTQLPSIVRLYFFFLSFIFVIPNPGMYGLKDTKPPPVQRYSPMTVYTERRRYSVYKRFLFIYQSQDHNSAIIKFMVIYVADKPRIIWHDSKWSPLLPSPYG